jgi:hypothetical protein
MLVLIIRAITEVVPPLALSHLPEAVVVLLAEAVVSMEIVVVVVAEVL